jgi:hypothetical protein
MGIIHLKRISNVKRKLGLVLFVIIVANCSLRAQKKEPEIEFDNLRLTGGSIISDVKNKSGGSGIGYSIEYTVEKYLFGTSGDLNLKTKKFASITIDLGGGIPQKINDDMDFFLGISTLSVNLNDYGAGPFNSAVLLKLRFKKLVLESKTNFWDWQKGKDPVLKENGYYGVSYIIFKSLAVGVQYRLYAEDARYLNFNVGLLY